MLYGDIHKMPFLVFRDIILAGNLSLLGEGTDEERAAAWEDILADYATALGESDSDGYISDRRELQYFKTQRFLVHSLVELLWAYMSKEGVFVKKWAEQLGKIVQKKIVFTTKEELHTQLESCILRSRGLIDVHIESLSDKIELYEKRNEGTDLKPTPEFFAKVLLNLHEFTSWQFRDDEITLYQYCELVRRYLQHQAYLDAQKK